MFDLRYVEGFEHVERCSCWCLVGRIGMFVLIPLLMK